MSERVLAIAAHPDDIEFVMAGTLIRLREAGFELHYLNVADGYCGSATADAVTIAATRAAEAQAAAESIGATFHASLVHDLEIFYTDELLRRLASVVRSVEPRIVLTHSPQDYMEDHVNTCRLAVTATFARGMPNYSTRPERAAISGEVTVYHAQPHGNRDPLGNVVRPELYVDIGEVMEEKTNMLAHHASQKEWLDTSQGLDSYLHTMQDLSAEVGSMSERFPYAEGWRKRLHLGFCGPKDDPLSACLARHVYRPSR